MTDTATEPDTNTKEAITGALETIKETSKAHGGKLAALEKAKQMLRETILITTDPETTHDVIGHIISIGLHPQKVLATEPRGKHMGLCPISIMFTEETLIAPHDTTPTPNYPPGDPDKHRLTLMENETHGEAVRNVLKHNGWTQKKKYGVPFLATIYAYEKEK